MKLSCPKCGAGNNIGRKSRFGGFQCYSCAWEFHGCEAKQPVTNGLFQMFTDYLRLNETPCPKCGVSIQLSIDTTHGGANGPERCYSCGKKLPNKYEFDTSQRRLERFTGKDFRQVSQSDWDELHAADEIREGMTQIEYRKYLSNPTPKKTEDDRPEYVKKAIRIMREMGIRSNFED